MGSLSDTEYDISKENVDLDWKIILPYENNIDKARHSDDNDYDVLLTPPDSGDGEERKRFLAYKSGEAFKF